jgi:hypothetical protein
MGRYCNNYDLETYLPVGRTDLNFSWTRYLVQRRRDREIRFATFGKLCSGPPSPPLRDSRLTESFESGPDSSHSWRSGRTLHAMGGGRPHYLSGSNRTQVHPYLTTGLVKLHKINEIILCTLDDAKHELTFRCYSEHAWLTIERGVKSKESLPNSTCRRRKMLEMMVSECRERYHAWICLSMGNSLSGCPS